MNYSVFLYEIHTIMLPTLEEGRAVQFPKANFTLHLLNKFTDLEVRAFAKEKLGLFSWKNILSCWFWLSVRCYLFQIVLHDPYDGCVDWWALGVMLFTMLTGMVCILCDFCSYEVICDVIAGAWG